MPAQHTTDGAPFGTLSAPGDDEERVREHAPKPEHVTSRSGNFTSRVAGWSAAHRKGVTRGWLAFVLVAFVLGSAAGMVQLKALEAENGQSRLADQTQAQQFPRERAGEEVLIENPQRPARRQRLSRGRGRSRRAPVAAPRRWRRSGRRLLPETRGRSRRTVAPRW